jgi:hypothetical protein
MENHKASPTSECSEYENEIHTHEQAMRNPFSRKRQSARSMSVSAEAATKTATLRRVQGLFGHRRRRSKADDKAEIADHEALVADFLARPAPEPFPRPTPQLRRQDATVGTWKEDPNYWSYNKYRSTTQVCPPPPLSSRKRLRPPNIDLGVNRSQSTAYDKPKTTNRAEVRAVSFHYPPTTPKIHLQKDKSPRPPSDHPLTPKRLASYITSGADTLDASRRAATSHVRRSAEIAISNLQAASDFRPPLAGIHFPMRSPLVFLKWQEDDDSDSDDGSLTFSCIGESKDADGKRVTTPELGRERRMSGTGEDVWTRSQRSGGESVCRVCGTAAQIISRRGLCLGCESAWRRSVRGFSVAPTEYDVDVKPSVPLNTKREEHPLPDSPGAYGVRYLEHRVGGDYRCMPRIEKIARADSRRGLIQSLPLKEYHTNIHNEPVSLYEQWLTPAMREELTTKEHMRWSPGLLEEGDEI